MYICVNTIASFTNTLVQLLAVTLDRYMRLYVCMHNQLTRAARYYPTTIPVWGPSADSAHGMSVIQSHLTAKQTGFPFP
jgi:hypothetical protein